MEDNLSLYATKLAQLKQEFSEIQTKLRENKKSFNKNQQKVFDFVMGRRDLIQFSINQEQYFANSNSKCNFLKVVMK